MTMRPMLSSIPPPPLPPVFGMLSPPSGKLWT